MGSESQPDCNAMTKLTCHYTLTFTSLSHLFLLLSQNHTKQRSMGGLSHLVEVADDFVEESEALEALLVDVVLVVELLVVGDLGEHDGDVFVALTVQFLRKNNDDDDDDQKFCSTRRKRNSLLSIAFQCC